MENDLERAIEMIREVKEVTNECKYKTMLDRAITIILNESIMKDEKNQKIIDLFNKMQEAYVSTAFSKGYVRSMQVLETFALIFKELGIFDVALALSQLVISGNYDYRSHNMHIIAIIVKIAKERYGMDLMIV